MERRCWLCELPITSTGAITSTPAPPKVNRSLSEPAPSSSVTGNRSYNEKVYTQAENTKAMSSQAMISCSSCKTGEKVFCSKEHLLLHRPATSCLPFRMEKSKDNGRQLVASRPISAGELVLKESSLFLIPSVQPESGLNACVECLDTVDEDNSQVCDACGLPLCKNHTKEHPIHQVECSLLLTCGVMLSWQDRSEFMDEHYAALAALRCMLASDSAGGTANLIKIQLEEKQEIFGQEDGAASQILDNVVSNGCWSQEKMIRACHYVQKHALCVSPEYGTRAVFPLGSMLEHSCIPNTRTFVSLTKEGATLEVRSTVPIETGGALLCSRANPLLDMYTRRESLREKLTHCTCARCCSRTELDSFTSAMACLSCDNIQGFFLPPGADTEVTDYTCDVCLGDLPDYVATGTTAELRPIVSEYDDFDVEEKEDFMNCLLTKFHQNHSLIIQLKTSVAKQLGRGGEEGSLSNADQDVLERKTTYCEELLSVLDIVIPGLTKERGLILYELVDSKYTLASKQFEVDRNAQSYKERCKEVQDRLGEALRCLDKDEGDKETDRVLTRLREIQDIL